MLLKKLRIHPWMAVEYLASAHAFYPRYWSEYSDMELNEIEKKIDSKKCHCGRKKGLRMFFCTPCYESLPKKIKIAMQRLIGYESVYIEACEFLSKKANE